MEQRKLPSRVPVEAEDVPTQVVQSYIKRAQLMGSTLYKSIFAEAFAEGEEAGRNVGLSVGLSVGMLQGSARVYARTIFKLLSRQLGTIDPSLVERLADWPNQVMLEAWHDEALELKTPAAARKLLKKIQNTPMPAATNGLS